MNNWEIAPFNKSNYKLALVITSIKQSLVLCDLNFYFPSQHISY